MFCKKDFLTGIEAVDPVFFTYHTGILWEGMLVPRADMDTGPGLKLMTANCQLPKSHDSLTFLKNPIQADALIYKYFCA